MYFYDVTHDTFRCLVSYFLKCLKIQLVPVNLRKNYFLFIYFDTENNK